MSDKTLEELSEWEAESGKTTSSEGGYLLLKWLQETWGESGKAVMMQFMVFYALMLIGFLFLWGMMRSTARLREIRRSIAETIREQKNRKFDVEEYYRTMPGGGYF